MLINESLDIHVKPIESCHYDRWYLYMEFHDCCQIQGLWVIFLLHWLLLPWSMLLKRLNHLTLQSTLISFWVY